MIGFALREGWRSFRTLGIGGLLTLAALTVTLALGALTAEGYLMLKNWQKSALESFEVEAFLVADITQAGATRVIEEAGKIDKVVGVRYISREEAAQRFKVQVGGDLLEVLGYNPLPPSIIVKLAGTISQKDAWRLVTKSLEKIDGVDEVVYQGDLLQELDEFYSRASRTLGILIGGAVLLSLFFTALTVAAAIRSRHEFIQIVLMCGGSRLMARGPFVALGGYYGAVAGVTGGVLTALILWIATLGWELDARLPLEWAPLMVGAGVLIGGVTAGWVAGRKIRTV